MFKLTPISTILFITTAINVAAAYVSWKRRKATKSGFYFALSMVSLTFWTLAAGLGYAAVPLGLKIFFAKMDAVGYHSALALLLLFILYFGGLEKWAEHAWVRALVFLLPISNILLVATNEWHGWVWTGFSPAAGNVWVFEHGPAFAWIVVTDYVFILSIISVLLKISFSGPEISRRQGRLLLAAAIVPVLANIIYLYGIKGQEGVDWSSITFSLTGLLFLWTLYGAHFLDLVPIARDKLVNSLSDGVIAIDTQNRIIDINIAAAKIIESPSEKLLGRNLGEVMPFFQPLLEEYPVQEVKIEWQSTALEKDFFEVLISPLFEKHDLIVGRLLMFHNITRLKEMAEAEREQRTLSEALSSSAAALNSTLKFDDLLDRIVDHVGQVVSHDSVGIILLDATRQVAEVVGYRDTRNSAVLKENIELSPSLMHSLRKMQETGEPIIVGDTGLYTGWNDSQSVAWIRDYLGVPIKVKGEVVGFLSLASARPHTFTPRDAGHLQAFVNHAAIAIENTWLYEEVKKLAITDPLTGIYNRTFFEAELERMNMSRDFPISIIIADVDNLKITNDQFGHAVGDQLLKNTAQLLQETFRAADIIARIGGDEFGVLLPNTDSETAGQLLSRLRSKLDGQNAERPELRVYLSQGVCTGERGRLMEAFIAADQFMYNDKAEHKSSR
ncbi:MAG: diguanylate cyclase [Anaerolineales bacterium]|nr:diguanylate cyclase [Anaerolineales bacterium]